MSIRATDIEFDAGMMHALFDRVYVINLVERTDRRQEVSAALQQIGLGPDDPLVQFFPAVRPADPGNFESIGARGCFMSHLEVLKDALAQGHRSILILEDDVDWTKAALDRGMRAAAIVQTDWDFLHGGLGYDLIEAADEIGLSRLKPDQEYRLTHFIGLRGDIIAKLVAYLEAMLHRPQGSPEGGPMHVDGAYSWFRRAHPEHSAYVCLPSVARQRSSKSDIYELSGWRATKAAELSIRALRPIRKLFRGS